MARLMEREDSGRDESGEAGSKQRRQDHGGLCLEPPEEVVFFLYLCVIEKAGCYYKDPKAKNSY